MEKQVYRERWLIAMGMFRHFNRELIEIKDKIKEMPYEEYKAKSAEIRADRMYWWHEKNLLATTYFKKYDEYIGVGID